MKIEQKEIKKSYMLDLIGSFLGLVGFILFIILYEKNISNLEYILRSGDYINIVKSIFDMFEIYFTDLTSFVLQAKDILESGYSFDKFIIIYKSFSLNFINKFALLIFWSGIYLRLTGNPIKRILQILSNTIIIVGTALLVSVAY